MLDIDYPEVSSSTFVYKYDANLRHYVMLYKSNKKLCDKELSWFDKVEESVTNAHYVLVDIGPFRSFVDSCHILIKDVHFTDVQVVPF